MFDKTIKIAGTQDAIGILATLRTTYATMKKLEHLVTRYSGGLDAEFNTAVNILFTAEEVTELGIIFGKLGALTADLETNHRNAIGL